MTTRLIVVGGFLGAGKTTLLLAAARILLDQGYKVGLITNDQGRDLVDTAFLERSQLPVAEVMDGCFCCRFDDLLSSIRDLRERVAPDVIFAEAVGSCTDLAATVLRPLRRDYSAKFVLAPLTVLVDVTRDFTSFPSSVNYLYDRQLAEAEVILLTKTDLTDKSRVGVYPDTFRRQYPAADVRAVVSTSGAGVADWLATVLERETRLHGWLDVDYERYGEAEACLGWLNANGRLLNKGIEAPAQWGAAILETFARLCQEKRIAVAHLKLHVTTPAVAIKASLVDARGPISWDEPGPGTDSGLSVFQLNARARTDPATLEAMARSAIAQNSGVEHAVIDGLACFSPPPPLPTYRLRPQDIEVLS